MHLHVLHDEVSTIERISHDATHEGCCQNHGIRTLFIEKLLNGILVCQVELFMRTAHHIVITSLLQVIPNSRTHKSVMSSYVYLRILIQHIIT